MSLRPRKQTETARFVGPLAAVAQWAKRGGEGIGKQSEQGGVATQRLEQKQHVQGMVDGFCAGLGFELRVGWEWGSGCPWKKHTKHKVDGGRLYKNGDASQAQNRQMMANAL